MSLPSSHPRLKQRPYGHDELIADAVVHAAAIIAGAIAFSVLFQKIAMHGRPIDGAAMAIYAAGFFALFGFSCAYNMAPPSPAKWLLRRFDHASIFVMIAGTYTALLSQAGLSPWTIALASVVWAGALLGVALKVGMPGRYEKIALVAYLALGWSAVVAFKPIFEALPIETSALIVIGGALYSIGVLFYLWKKLRFQNVVWHAFVTAAAGCHFAGVLQAVGR
jgi:hemolysin III